MKLILGSRLDAEKGISYSDGHRRRLEDQLKFPRRLKLSSSLTAYLETEIDDWIAARIAERDAAERNEATKMEAAAAEDDEAEDDAAEEDGDDEDEDEAAA